MVFVRNPFSGGAAENESSQPGKLSTSAVDLDNVSELPHQFLRFPVKRRGREGVESGSTPVGVEFVASPAFLSPQDGPVNDLVLRDGGLWIAEALAQNDGVAIVRPDVENTLRPQGANAVEWSLSGVRSTGGAGGDGSGWKSSVPSRVEYSVDRDAGNFSSAIPGVSRRFSVASGSESTPLVRSDEPGSFSVMATEVTAQASLDRGTGRAHENEHEHEHEHERGASIEVGTDERDRETGHETFYLNPPQETEIHTLLSALDGVFADTSDEIASLANAELEADTITDRINVWALLSDVQTMVFEFRSDLLSDDISAVVHVEAVSHMDPVAVDAAGSGNDLAISPALINIQQDLATLLLHHQLTLV